MPSMIQEQTKRVSFILSYFPLEEKDAFLVFTHHDDAFSSISRSK